MRIRIFFVILLVTKNICADFFDFSWTFRVKNRELKKLLNNNKKYSQPRLEYSAMNEQGTFLVH